MAATRTFVRVPPDSSGSTAVALLEINRGGQLVRIQEVMAAYQADCTNVGINVTTAAQGLVAANPVRRGLNLQNISDTRIIGRFGVGNIPDATPGAEVGFSIEPNGGSYSFTDMVDTRVLNLIHGGSGVKRLLVTEWSE